jgi:hypothetical protein
VVGAAVVVVVVSGPAGVVVVGGEAAVAVIDVGDVVDVVDVVELSAADSLDVGSAVARTGPTTDALKPSSVAMKTVVSRTGDIRPCRKWVSRSWRHGGR